MLIKILMDQRIGKGRAWRGGGRGGGGGGGGGKGVRRNDMGHTPIVLTLVLWQQRKEFMARTF